MYTASLYHSPMLCIYCSQKFISFYHNWILEKQHERDLKDDREEKGEIEYNTKQHYDATSNWQYSNETEMLATNKKTPNDIYKCFQNKIPG